MSVAIVPSARGEEINESPSFSRFPYFSHARVRDNGDTAARSHRVNPKSQYRQRDRLPQAQQAGARPAGRQPRRLQMTAHKQES
jgi:hypothetical protein